MIRHTIEYGYPLNPEMELQGVFGMPKKGIEMEKQMKILYLYDGEWPTQAEVEMSHDRVVRVVRTEVSVDTGSLYIYMAYGCTHRKMSNIPNGRFLCGAMNCPHYVGKAKYEGKYD